MELRSSWATSAFRNANARYACPFEEALDVRQVRIQVSQTPRFLGNSLSGHAEPCLHQLTFNSRLTVIRHSSAGSVNAASNFPEQDFREFRYPWADIWANHVS
jgi:hypothetical protein